MKKITHNEYIACHKDLVERRNEVIEKINACTSQKVYFDRLLETSNYALDRYRGGLKFRFMRKRFSNESKVFIEYIAEQSATGVSTLEKLNADLAAIDKAIEKLKP